MATNTTNYGFKKPDESDFYDVADQNKNWDLADEALKNLDTPTFEDYTGSTAVPSATDAIDQIKSKGKLGTLLSNIKAAFKGACLIGHIVNNCVTDNAGLPLSAAQGKVLKDLYTQLYSESNTFIRHGPDWTALRAWENGKEISRLQVNSKDVSLYTSNDNFSTYTREILLTQKNMFSSTVPTDWTNINNDNVPLSIWNVGTDGTWYKGAPDGAYKYGTLIYLHGNSNKSDWRNVLIYIPDIAAEKSIYVRNERASTWLKLTGTTVNSVT